VAESRRLRRLVPDEALFERRVSGESFRALASDFGVTHTTLLRFFRRPEVSLELREARRRLVAKRAEEQTQRSAERALEAGVRRRAREEEERDRVVEAWSRLEVGRRSLDEEWLDQRKAPQELTSRKRYSAHDRTAAEVVARGGGVEQVIEATGLRSRENVYRLDAQIMARALANDLLRSKAAPSGLPRLRRLAPDADLLRRRASGESLRDLASDYAVCHTSLSRYFRRPEIAKRLRSEEKAQRRRDRRGRPTPTKSHLTTPSDPGAVISAGLRLIRAEAGRIICPHHHQRPTVARIPVRVEQGGWRLTVEFCCRHNQERFLRRIRKKLPRAEIESPSPSR
jgi:hypothetical protein